MRFVREFNTKDKIDNNSSRVDIFNYRLFHNQDYTKSDYLELKKDIENFIKNEATEEEKNELIKKHRVFIYDLFCDRTRVNVKTVV